MEGASCHYTSLPKLHYDEDVPERTSCVLSLSDRSYSPQTIIAAWCKLLRGLTGDEQPVFRLDNKPARWNATTQAVDYDELTIEDGSPSGLCAGLSFHEVCITNLACHLLSLEADVWQETLPTACGLYLKIGLAEHDGVLTSINFATAAYLEEVGQQLRSLLCEPYDACQLSVLNKEPTLVPGPARLHDLFAKHRHESTIALEFLMTDNTTVKLGYNQLDRLTDGLASKIHAAISSSESRDTSSPVVPIILPQSPELYVAWLAVLKAGAVVCPVNIDTPPERLKFIRDDTSAKVVVTSSGLAAEVTEVLEDVITVTPNLEEDIKCEERLHNEPDPGAPAYIMYTSGSTGLPKGVVISHRASTQALLAHDHLIPPLGRLLQFASPTFDVSVFEIFFPWLRGVTLVGCERSKMLNDLPAVIGDMRIDAIELTPTVAEELVRCRSKVPSLKVLLTIGEMLTRRVVDEFGGNISQQGILHGMYGPTEAAIHCTIAQHIQAGDSVGNIGVPLDSVTALVIGLDGGADVSVHPSSPRLLPIGHVGELALAGPQLASGYLNREKETQLAFCDLPGHGRIYRSGDKARLHPNGSLECLGRITGSQVKLRGQRIELGEIEQIICKAKNVRGAVVAVIDGILVGFLTTDRPPARIRRVVRTCKSWLPAFMVPGDFVLLDAFPRLPSGKVDRQALTEHYRQKWDRRGSQQSCSQDSLECELLQTAEQVMGAPLSVEESLAAKGLESLSAIKLSSMLRSKGIDFSVADILNADCIRQLRARVNTEHAYSHVPINRSVHEEFESIAATVLQRLETTDSASEIQKIHPCSPMQAAMLSETMRDHRAYFNIVNLQFEVGIEEDDVKTALRTVAQHNEILRSGFYITDNASHSFVQIVWHSLEDRQFEEGLKMGEDIQHKLLRPLMIRLWREDDKVRAQCQIHHALYDGWSWRLMCRDITRALLNKPLPNRRQFSEISSYFLNISTSRVRDEALDYWKAHLQGYQPCRWPDFAVETGSASGRDILRRVMRVRVPEAKRLAHGLRISMQTIFQSAFAYLLSSYAGNTDITIGSVSSGRTMPIAGVESIIGPCVATIPLRTDIKASRTCRDLLVTLHGLNRRSLHYDFVPLQILKKDAGLSADQRLFDGLFVWQDMLMEQEPDNRPDLVSVEETGDHLECAVLLELSISCDDFQATLTCQQSAMPHGQADLTLRLLDELAFLIVNYPDLPLSKLTSHLPRELLSISNFPHAQEVSSVGLTEGMQAVAASHPERLAIEFVNDFQADAGLMRTTSLTYKEFEIKSGALAQHLQTIGVQPGDLVAVFLEKSPELYVSLMSIALIGAAFIAITPSTPTARIQHILEESSCRLMLASVDTAIEVSIPTFRVVNIDESLSSGLSSPLTRVDVDESMPAYVVFTSGSTGRPKGVVVTRKNLQSNMSVLAKRYPTNPQSRLLQACSQAFDVAVFEIFFTLNSGMTLCAATNDVLFRDIEMLIAQMGVTHLSLTATVAAMIDPARVPGVEVLITAGDPVTPTVVRRWGDRGLWQGYGPSETTNIVTLKEHVKRTDRPNDIGRALDNTSVILVSETPEMRLVPIGAIGEICIGGDQVAQGYLKNAELTGRKFIQDAEFGLLFRSGDLARMTTGGSLLFQGRRDNQIKIRGLRIDLDEIDALLMQQASVTDSLTIVDKDANHRHEQLVSFIMPTTRPAMTGSAQSAIINTIFQTLQTILPSYMIPSLIIPIRSFPRNSSGKKDRLRLVNYLKTLDRTSLSGFARTTGLANPEEQFTMTEQTIATCVAAVTGTPMESIHGHSSFYTLGLDSVSAVALSASLKTHGVGQVDVSRILTHSSVRQLARYMEDSPYPSRTSEETALVEPLMPAELIETIRATATRLGHGVVKVLPCTPLQEVMLARLTESTAYKNTLIFRVLGDVECLRSAWEHVIDRHDILRTRFLSTFDVRFPYAQVVLGLVDIDWHVAANVDQLTKAPADEQPSSVEDLIPYRFRLLRSAEQTLLKLDIHHAVYDATAMSVILKDVESVYRGGDPQSSGSFEDFLRYIRRPHTPDCVEFWQSYLQETCRIKLMPKEESNTAPSFLEITEVMPMSLQQLTDWCKRYTCTFLSILQAAWAKTLAYFSSAQDICFGNVYSGRTVPIRGVERIAGPCFNTLPIRASMSRTMTNMDMVHRLRDDNHRILPYSSTSLRKLGAFLNSEAASSFDTLIVLQDDRLHLDKGIWALVDEFGAMDLPLICEVVPDKESGQVVLTVHFEETLLPSSDAKIVMSAFITMLHHIVAYPFAQVIDTAPVSGCALEHTRFTHWSGRRDPHITCDVSPGNSVDVSTLTTGNISKILSELSKVDMARITPDTTIYQLGLDSINALQLAAKFKVAGLDISAAEILEKPSLREMAETVTKKSDNSLRMTTDTFDFVAFAASQAAAVAKLKVARETVQRVSPCTPVQAGMLASFLNTDGQSYFHHYVFRLAATVGLDRLRQAWQALVDRHEMLRTGFFQTFCSNMPFGMLTYARGCVSLPWRVEERLSIGSEELSSLRNRLSRIALANLSNPPWFLSVQDGPQEVFVQLSAHHALYDAEAFNILLTDLASLLQENHLTSPVSIRPLQELMINEAISCSSSAEDLWRDAKDYLRPTNFPNLHPAHCRSPSAIETVTYASKHASSTLQSLCSKAKVSLQAACQAAWARILAAYVGEDRVTCGVVFSGRSTLPEAQGAVFPCLITLPMYYDTSATNRQLLNHIMTRQARMARYQFTPLSKIHEWTDSDSSLFNALFVFQRPESSPPEYPLWTIIDETADVDYAISLEVITVASSLRLTLSFRGDLVPRAHGDMILRQFDCLLHQCLSSLDAEAKDFQFLSNDLLSITPSRVPSIPTPCRLLHGLFEMSVERYGSRTALEYVSRTVAGGIESRKWTYVQMNHIANQFANLLLSLKTLPGSLIAICLDKCPEAYMAILGILKAGCSYVAIDPTAPPARRKFILQDSKARVLLAASDTGLHAEEILDIPLITVDKHGLLDGFPTSPPILLREVSSDDVSYCLYTSGTTGTPKGCQITHNNAVQAMLSFQRLFEGHWEPSSRWLQFASFHFDVSVLEQYWSWSVGICLVSCPRDLLFEDLAGTLAHLQITHIDLTPSLARLVHPKQVPSLQKGVFITGGEALRQDILDEWGPYNVIYNGYGPTEVTIGCTMYPRVPAHGKPSNIGRQFDNVSSYVFEPDTTKPTLLGGVGELCVGGPLVGKGYLNRDDLTKDRFLVLDRFRDRVYRTGDLVRQYYDGSFCFLGRQDDQIKLRGQRLEIGEINDVIRRSSTKISGVATVVARQSQQLKDQLVSFVATPAPADSSEDVSVTSTLEARQTARTARNTCASELPGYMVPTHIIPLNKLPLSGNNKLDTQKLRSIYASLTPKELQKLSQSSVEASHVTKDLEDFIAIVADILGFKAACIPPDANIFQLGLDSITVTTFARDLANRGFSSASPARIIRNPTIAGLHNALQEQRSESVQRALGRFRSKLDAFSQTHRLAIARSLHVSSAEIEHASPCTPLQEGILYQYVRSEGTSYLANFVYKLSAEVTTCRLTQAWALALQAMPILRTKFVHTDNGFAQAVVKTDRLPVYQVNITGVENCADLIREDFTGWCDKRHQLSSPWKVLILEGPDTLMAVSIFHAIYDAVSLPLLLKEVARFYMSSDYIPKTPSLTDALPWMLAFDASSAREYWQTHLTNSRHRLVTKASTGSISRPILITQHSSQFSQLEWLRRELRVTQQAVLLACWLYVIAQHFGYAPALGIVVSGRSVGFDRAHEVIGPMFNTIPCAVHPTGYATVRELVKACHEYYVSTLPYQHTPLRDIRRWLRMPADTPLFDTLFVFHKSSLDDSPCQGLWKLVSSDSEQDFALSLEVQRPDDHSLELTLATNDAIMDYECAQGLCDSYVETLQACMQDAFLPLSLREVGAGESEANPRDAETCNSPRRFEWSWHAIKLRGQVAILAGVDASSVQADTSIFELGLDSIDAIRLSSRLKKQGLTLSVSAIMQGKTVSNLAASLSLCSEEEQADDRPYRELKERLQRSLDERLFLDMRTVEMIAPSTPLQEAMVAEMVSSGFRRYYNHDVLSIASWVDVHRLKCAWSAVVRENPVLRTRFAEIVDPSLPFSYAQVVCNADEEEPMVWDAKDVEIDAFDDEIQQTLTRLRPSDALTSPPVRLRLITASDSQRALVFSLSHALYDGWSLDLMHRDVRTAYFDPSLSAPSRPPYDKALGRIIASAGDDAANYWQGALRGCNAYPFPEQPYAGGDDSNSHHNSRTLAIPASRLSSFCRRQNISMQTFCIASWSLLLASYLQQLDVVFGTVMLGRDTEDAEAMMFPMFNTVAVRSILHGTRSEFLKYMQEVLDSAREFQHFPLRKAKALAGQQATDQPLFDALVIYQRGPQSGRKAVDDSQQEDLYRSVGGESDVEIPICAEMEVLGDEVVWRVVCCDTHCGADDVRALLQRIERIIGEILNHPEEDVIFENGEGLSVCNAFAISDRATSLDDHGLGGAAPGPLNEGEEGRETWEPTPVEAKIRDTVASVAGIPSDKVSREDNIFHLGLDSISAIKVCSLLRRQSIFLAVSEIMKAGTTPVMARVARTIDDKDDKGDTNVKEAELGVTDEQIRVLQRHGVDTNALAYVLPATAGQTYMLAAHECSEGALFYPSFAYRMTAVEQDIDRSRLGAAWEALTRRLPILRTVFVPSGTRAGDHLYLQAVLREVGNPTHWVAEDELGRLANSRGLHAQYRAGGLPVKLYAAQRTSGGHLKYGKTGDAMLILHIHHALYDAVSLPLMMRHLVRLYMLADTDGSPGIGLAEHSRYLRNHSSQAQRERFWKEYLRDECGAANKHLKQPVANESEKSQQQGPKHRTEQYRESLVASLEPALQRARTHGVSIQAVFLACFARVWQKVLHHSDSQRQGAIIVGVYLSNRGYKLSGVSRMIAPTLNIVPLRIPVSGDIWDAALEIQDDLRKISSEEVSCVSLMEIWRWTGVRVDVIVNFLKDVQDVAEEDAQDEEAATVIESIPIDTLKSPSDDASECDQEGTNNPVATATKGATLLQDLAEVYAAGVDIEAAVRGSRLDVGVFGAEGKISEDESEELLRFLRQEMEHLG